MNRGSHDLIRFFERARSGALGLSPNCWEREDVKWAAALGLPTFFILLKQLTPSANDAFFGLPSSGEPRPSRR